MITDRQLDAIYAFLSAIPCIEGEQEIVREERQWKGIRSDPASAASASQVAAAPFA